MKKIELTIYNCTECPYYDKEYTGPHNSGCLELDRIFDIDDIALIKLNAIPADCPLEDI